ncbi:MAG: phosphatase PAP2 family protein [Blastocatellia bacterium]
MLDMRSMLRYSKAAPINLILMAVSIGAQTPAGTPQPSSAPTSPPQQSTTKPSLERQFLRNILRDQRAIWTSPFHLSGQDACWLVPLGLGTAALIGTDHRTAKQLGDNVTRLSISRHISRIGVGYTAAGIAGGFYLVGRLTKNEKARETGILSAEAFIDGVIVSQVLKTVTQRPRPIKDDGSGEFFAGGTSFPSGHSITAWALAAVVANEYHDHRLVQIGAYSLAALVSMSRFTGRNHFLSDVLVGSVIGYGIGRHVYRAHHDPNVDALSGKLKQFKFSPHFKPGYRGRASVYGISMNYSF